MFRHTRIILMVFVAAAMLALTGCHGKSRASWNDHPRHHRHHHYRHYHRHHDHHYYYGIPRHHERKHHDRKHHDRGHGGVHGDIGVHIR